jgi:CRISPR-associated exonuclease Cas4
MEQEFLPITALSHYFFCKRDPYYVYVVHTPEPPTETMEAGKEKHTEDPFQAFLRRLEPKHFFRSPPLRSPQLGVSGIPDYVFITRHSEIVPAEVKYTSSIGHTSLKWVAQLVGYALIIETNYVYVNGELIEDPEASIRTVVKRGALFNALTKKLQVIEITEDLKKKVLNGLLDLRKMIITGEFPQVKQPWSKCVNCWYRRYCYP